MRKDPNLITFIEHNDWYRFKKGAGYLPTECAPDEAKEAMKAYNK